MDWVSDLLFWLEGDLFSPGVWVSKLNGSFPVRIMGRNRLYKPQSIAVHPVKGTSCALAPDDDDVDNAVAVAPSDVEAEALEAAIFVRDGIHSVVDYNSTLMGVVVVVVVVVYFFTMG